MSAKRPHVYIATPTSGGLMKSSYVASLVAMVDKLHGAGIRTDFANIDAAHIPDQRDALADMALKSGATHLLFIDSDMMFAADLAQKYLAFGKPLVGALCTRRKLDLKKVEAALAERNEFGRALAMGHEFTAKFDREQLQGQGEFCKVLGLGLAFALIERECFETMAARLKLKRYPGRYASGEMVGYFQELTGDDGQRVSEDLSFCQRWRECGGEVWGDAFADIKHVGDFAYGVPFANWLGLDKKPVAAPKGRR